MHRQSRMLRLKLGANPDSPPNPHRENIYAKCVDVTEEGSMALRKDIGKSCYWSWGDPEHRFDPDASGSFLRTINKALGLETESECRTPPPFESLKIPPPRLPPSFIRQWSLKGLSLDRLDRLRHAAGKSYRDLIRLRQGSLDRYPDGVLHLQSEADLKPLFASARRYGLVLVPFGGGTGVVGGTECLGPKNKPIVVVDLKSLDQLLALDAVSGTATFQAGVLGPRLESLLNGQGFTLGHFPQSFEFSTLGGWVATRSAGQNSTKYGKIEDMVVSLKVHTPKGILETRNVPASATGPSVKEILIGSEGLYGIITEATVKVQRSPEAEEGLAAFFPDFESGIHGIRRVMQNGLKPSVIRLSDPRETTLFGRTADNASFLLLVVEGTKEEVDRHMGPLRQILLESGGVPAPESFGVEWKKGRFELPYLRDDLLDRGLLIDTLETAAEWSRLDEIHRSMEKAFTKGKQREPLLFGCHLSHAYPDGASLYFTFIGKQRRGAELEQWNEIKTLATEVILKHGGTLSHHHGVGYDHRRWMKEEQSPLGLDVLRQVKQALDPDNLLNPEKLISKKTR